MGAGRAHLLRSAARFDASLLAASASRKPARYSTCLGVPRPDHSSSTDEVRQHLLPAASTLPRSPSLAGIGARPLP